MKDLGFFRIESVEHEEMLQDRSRFLEVELPVGLEMQLGSLIHELPGLKLAQDTAGLYKVTFPRGGSTNQLMQFKTGGVGSPVIVNGKISAHAAFVPAEIATGAMVVFQTMSIITSQYYLHEISSSLNVINQNVSRIIEFLYRDKKAELLAEISFVKQSFECFEDTAVNELQRISTITSLQRARKVAMKDIEFYLMDLQKTVDRESDLNKAVREAISIKNSLDLAIQLYGFSQILEIAYAQNFLPEYLTRISASLLDDQRRWDRVILKEFSKLHGKIEHESADVFKQLMRTDFSKSLKRIEKVIEELEKEESNTESSRASWKQVLDSFAQPLTYYINSEGKAFLEKA